MPMPPPSNPTGSTSSSAAPAVPKPVQQVGQQASSLQPTMPRPTPAAQSTPVVSAKPLTVPPAQPQPAQSTSTSPMPKPAAPVATPTPAPQTVFSRPVSAQVQPSVPAKPAGSSLPPPTQPQPARPIQSAQPQPVQSIPPMPKPTVPMSPVMPAKPVAATPTATTTTRTTTATPAATKPLSTPPPTPPATPTTSPTPASLKAEIKKPPFWLFAIIGVVLLGILGYFLFTALAGGAKPTAVNSGATTGSTSGGAAGKQTATPTTLVYWGLWEPSEVMSEVIKEFETQYPQYTIDYRKQSFKDYRERLQTAIASGNGPDLYRFHATWVPMLQDDLAIMPASVMTTADFEKTFYPIAAQQLEVQGKIVGIPLMYDGLALYYNKAMLKSANAEPPQTWADLKTLADALTVPSNKSERDRAPLQRAGLAIGNSTNVEHFSDILGLLILQNGGDPSAPNSNEVRDALLFYTNFIKEDKVWSDAMPSSTVAFARGDAAMMFAPSWRALDIKAMNPDLDFGLAPVPKLGDKRISWASYWAEGVNAKSKNQQGAWAFINFLASADVQKKFFSAASQVRAFGEPYSRQDLAGELSSDPILANILAGAPTAQSWYLTSFTHDNGLDDQMIQYYGDAITAVLAGKSMDQILTTLSAGTTQVLRQYNLASSQAKTAAPAGQ